MGHTQPLHTNSLMRLLLYQPIFRLGLPETPSLLLQLETGICDSADPFGGSHALEALTEEIYNKAKLHLQEIDDLGGMPEAIEKGVPKLRIEESAARIQARIDSGQQVIVGVNKYKVDVEEAIPVLVVDNAHVRQSQIDRLKELKSSRNEQTVQQTLQALEDAARLEMGICLALAVDACKARATVGEVSDALERVFGRHQAQIRSISGVYTSELQQAACRRRVIRGRYHTTKGGEVYRFGWSTAYEYWLLRWDRMVMTEVKR